jgi:hypothetical protein
MKQYRCRYLFGQDINPPLLCVFEPLRYRNDCTDIVQPAGGFGLKLILAEACCQTSAVALPE